MKYLFLSVPIMFSTSCMIRCYEWDKPIKIEDNRACQAARAGDGFSNSRYHDCLVSLGYGPTQVECKL